MIVPKLVAVTKAASRGDAERSFDWPNLNHCEAIPMIEAQQAYHRDYSIAIAAHREI
jgi:hypothetical protein